MTTIPKDMLRITIGSKELYPKQERLLDWGRRHYSIIVKLRLPGGGVRYASSNNIRWILTNQQTINRTRLICL